MNTGKIPFSKRTAWDLAESSLARRLRERRAGGLSIADLTASNPTRCGFSYGGQELLAGLTDARVMDYDPEPRGMLTAREAICAYYNSHSAAHLANGFSSSPISPEQVLLTTSTSEAYSFLFRLLCDPGDEVLIMQPSYPLFEFLADLDDIRLVPYPLVYDHGWQLDVNTLLGRITPRTRAITLVHPNNPTGHFTKPWEREALESICAERGLALIVDEVFLDYGLEADYSLELGYNPEREFRREQDHGDLSKGRSFAAGQNPALTFVLSGLSKIAGLPQMKAAWIVCLGPERFRIEAQNRLEMIADTFLSMNAPVQYALPRWLSGRQGIQHQIEVRTSSNLMRLDQLLASQQVVSRLKVEAGWYAVLRIPALRSDEETALQLLEAGVATQPGYYFGFPPSGWLIISLLSPAEEFNSGVKCLIGVLNS